MHLIFMSYIIIYLCLKRIYICYIYIYITYIYIYIYIYITYIYNIYNRLSKEPKKLFDLPVMCKNWSVKKTQYFRGDSD